MKPSAAAKHKAALLAILQEQGIDSDCQVVLTDSGLEIRVSIKGPGRNKARKLLPTAVDGLKVVVK